MLVNWTKAYESRYRADGPAGAGWIFRLWLECWSMRLADQQTGRQKMGAFDRVGKRQTRTSVKEGSELGATSQP